MSQKSIEFADNKKELNIQKQQLEDWKKVADTYPDIASKLKYVLIFQKKLINLKAELQAIIDAPDGAPTDPIRNIQLINVELPQVKQALEDNKNALIDAFLESDIDIELNFLFLEYIKFEEGNENNSEDESDFNVKKTSDVNESFDVKTALNENIIRIEEELSIMSTLEKKSKRKWQFWK